MDTHSLNLFLAIVRDKTISAAARSLNMTQPALSRQMQYLEEELGTKLFLRGRRHITLTEEGKFLQKRAGEILELMERTRQAFREGSQVAGEVFIAGGETRAMRYVALAARKAVERHPGLSFNIFSGNGDDVRERLDRGLADFGIFIQPVDMRSYEYLRLPAKDVWGVLMPGDHPLAARETRWPPGLARRTRASTWLPPTTCSTTRPFWWSRAWALPSALRAYCACPRTEALSFAALPLPWRWTCALPGRRIRSFPGQRPFFLPFSGTRCF